MTVSTSSKTGAAAFEPIVGAHLDHATEPQSSRWLFAPFDAAVAVTTGWLDYAIRVGQRGATPLDVAGDMAEWFRAASSRPSPTWSTPHKVIREWPVARLLDFSTGTTALPTLVLPPQAGHASTIVDHTPTQSQLRTALEQGLDSLYVLDWTGATEETKHTTIEDYISILDATVERLGGKVNLVGDCQGGWLGAIYAALRPDSVNTLSVGAAPIDFHAGRSAIHDWTRRMAVVDEMTTYRIMVGLNGGVHRGGNQVLGFKMMEPAGEIQRLMDLWANIGDPEYVERYIDFVTWFESEQDLAGDFYLWVVEHLFVNNELVQGTLTVGGEVVDLGRITAPVYLLAGTEDHITPPDQVWALASHVGTPTEDVHSRFLEAGHLGLFMGRAALREHWTPIFASIRDRSDRRPPKTPVAQTTTAAPKKVAPAVTAPQAKTTAKPAAKKVTPAKVTTKAGTAKATPAKVSDTKAAPAKATPTKVSDTKATPAKATPAVKKNTAATAPAATKAPATKAPATKPAKAKKPATAKKPASVKKSPVTKTTAPKPATTPAIQPAPPVSVPAAKQDPAAVTTTAPPAKQDPAPAPETTPAVPDAGAPTPDATSKA